VKEREIRERLFFFIKILDWEATVLPNTVATQAWSPKIGKLLWLIFLNFFQIFPILGNRTAYRASATSALRSDYLTIFF
jgi:hypothetical protein